MISDLNSLEQKLALFMQTYQVLRNENQDLRTRVANLEADKHRLEEAMETARQRVEALIERLPGDNPQESP